MTMQLTPPLAAYPYVQYNDDDDIGAFFMAYNSMAQEYVDFFNEYNLADYNAANIADELLDWISEGIYGMRRPYLVDGSASAPIGPLGTIPLGDEYLGFFGWSAGSPPTYSFVDNAVFRKVITWNFFKGDGVMFNINWLKRRIVRFLTDESNPESTYDVSVYFIGSNGVIIDIPDSDLAKTFRSLVRSGIVSLPFQYAFTVNLI